MLQAKTVNLDATRRQVKADEQNAKTQKTLTEIILAEKEHIHNGGRRYFADNAEDMRDYFGKN